MRRPSLGGRAIAVRRRLPGPTPWWVWAALAAGTLAAMPARAQAPTVPEQIEPRQAPTLPPGAGGDQGLTAPRSETPETPLDGARPVPDRGLVKPAPAVGTTPVIRPPAVGGMPVIRPPGSPGGDPSVVPK